MNPAPVTPVWALEAGRETVSIPGRYLVAEVARYDDEFFAYLMFTHLRASPPFRGDEVLLTAASEGGTVVYPIRVHLEADLLQSIPRLASAKVEKVIGGFDLTYLNRRSLARLRNQTLVFLNAYNLPNRRKLETFTPAELTRYTRHFLQFKSFTDPRVLSGGAPVPTPLTEKQAARLAADIVSVSTFFAIPVDFFLGIGAMENNYMDVKGDLGNAVWKRRPDKGDIVLRRRGNRVLVLNESSGVWQITRETLRYAHRLYLKDTRDYSALPTHLRPPQALNVDEVAPGVLTTYAGIFFRYLLDRFSGDLVQAVGAYNGGPGNPNPRYEAGVRRVAEYARRVMEHAAALGGRRAVETRFIAASRSNS
jgi:hypothetical protein